MSTAICRVEGQRHLGAGPGAGAPGASTPMSWSYNADVYVFAVQTAREHVVYHD
jgi:hypothetical protein